ncbi:MAG: phytanoyl-CoA dioxygenase family protein [Gemmatimonadetes bacterium]|nr:phytanoyl-CoA dioxygenase family protein [Gemmatimonadota bacterium]
MSKTFWDSTPRHFPTHDELAALDRNLRFHPAPETAGKRLTAEQRQSFNREGYLLPFRVFSDAEIGRLRSRFDGWLEEAQRQGADSYSIVSAHIKHGIVWDLLRDRRMTAYVGDILGSDFICWGAHFFCKMPGDGKGVSWHQDASYWPLSPSKTVSVWLAVDRADRENACMQFVAGSHLHGHLDFVRSAESEANILNQTVPEAERFGHRVVDVELEAGEISLHSDLLLHGSAPNLSDRRRCGLTLRYAAAEVRAEYNWNSEGVVVSGSDPGGHWADPPRPEAD